MILGGDGYLGWPAAMYFAGLGHEVTVIDNYLRRRIAEETGSTALIQGPQLEEKADIFKSHFQKSINVINGDCANIEFLSQSVNEISPEAIIHFAEQPSAPYSMMGEKEASTTFHNNLGTTFSLIWAVINHAPNAHVIKLGTMGEYGTPNIDIEEGWLEVLHNGRTEKFLYPRQASSLYHTTKVLDTDLLWFYVRLYGLKVTDLMQGPVYGLETTHTVADKKLLPNFHYDDIFGTVVNRFICQAVAGIPLTVFGQGGQTRGYLNLQDTLQCINLAMSTPPTSGELRIFNQFTEQFTVNELAQKVKEASKVLGIKTQIKSIPNPRQELEDHYYNPKHTGLLELGLEPTFMTTEVLAGMIDIVAGYKEKISEELAMPRVAWKRTK